VTFVKGKWQNALLSKTLGITDNNLQRCKVVLMDSNATYACPTFLALLERAVHVSFRNIPVFFFFLFFGV
jgi:hypothetical protein